MGRMYQATSVAGTIHIRASIPPFPSTPATEKYMSVGTTEKMEPTSDRTPEVGLDFARQDAFQEDQATAKVATKHCSHAASGVLPEAMAAFAWVTVCASRGECRRSIGA